MLSISARNLAWDALLPLLDGGYLRIYPAPEPPDMEADPGVVPLAELRFQDPAAAPATNGRATAYPLTSDLAAAGGGVPSWFRAVTAGGETVLQDSVGLDGSPSPLKINTLWIEAGAEVVIGELVFS